MADSIPLTRIWLREGHRRPTVGIDTHTLAATRLIAPIQKGFVTTATAARSTNLKNIRELKRNVEVISEVEVVVMDTIM